MTDVTIFPQSFLRFLCTALGKRVHKQIHHPLEISHVQASKRWLGCCCSTHPAVGCNTVSKCNLLNPVNVGKRNREAQPHISVAPDEEQRMRQQFAKLTESATLLLNTGDLEVYSQTRVCILSFAGCAAMLLAAGV